MKEIMKGRKEEDRKNKKDERKRKRSERKENKINSISSDYELVLSSATEHKH